MNGPVVFIHTNERYAFSSSKRPPVCTVVAASAGDRPDDPQGSIGGLPEMWHSFDKLEADTQRGAIAAKDVRPDAFDRIAAIGEPARAA